VTSSDAEEKSFADYDQLKVPRDDEVGGG